MLRHFLATGRVDYMKWCQPTFIGVLPIAAPWALVGGTGMASLSLLGVAYTLLFITGLYLFAVPYAGAVRAAVLCASIAGFLEFFPAAATFMTDVPYVAYFVWFLFAHDRLTSPGSRGGARIGTWVLWGVAFLLAASTRPFIFVVVPVFFLEWRLANDKNRRIYGMCTLLATGLAILSFALMGALGDNRFRPIEQTALREVFVLHDYRRFNIQMMLISAISTAAMALPALLLSAEARRARLSALDVFAALIGLTIGFYYWRRGMIPCVYPFLSQGAVKVITFAQAVGGTVGFMLMGRLLCAALRHVRGGVFAVLTAVIVVQFLAMPIMQHPLLRHAMPAFVALLALVAVAGVRASRGVTAVAMALIALMASGNAIASRRDAAAEATVWDGAQALVHGGVPLDQLDGGWGWFCYQHLRPGQPDPKGYRERYYELQDRARYSVQVRQPAAGQKVIRATTVPVPAGTPIHVWTVDRGTSVGSAKEGT
jgi:hypothetical protein